MVAGLSCREVQGELDSAKISVTQWAGVEHVVAADVTDTASLKPGFGTWVADSPDLDELMGCTDGKRSDSYR
jgi:hypothetical protein